MIYDQITNSDRIKFIVDVIGKDNIPEFVNDSEVSTIKSASKGFYAVNTKDGKFLPITTPEDTYVSAAYYFANTIDGNKLPNNTYDIIKQAVAVHNDSHKNLNLSEHIKHLEQAFVTKIAEKQMIIKKGSKNFIEVPSGNTKFSIKKASELPVFLKVVEDSENTFNDFEKYSIIKQANQINVESNFNLDLKFNGDSISDILASTDVKKLAESMLKSAALSMRLFPEESLRLAEIAKDIYDSPEKYNDISDKVVKMASIAIEETDNDDDILDMIDKPAIETTITIDGEAYDEDDFNAVDEDKLVKIYGQSFVDDIKDADEKYNLTKIRSALEAFSERDKSTLTVLLGRPSKSVEDDDEDEML